MPTSHDVIQGYNGIAAVDEKHQIIVGAEAFGQGPENNLLKPTIESVADNIGDAYIQAAKVTAHSGFHSEETVAYCFEENIDAHAADGNFRIRDPGLWIGIGIAINQKPSCRKTLHLQKLK